MTVGSSKGQGYELAKSYMYMYLDQAPQDQLKLYRVECIEHNDHFQILDT